MAVNTIWEINGLELELDMSDYDTAVKYREAFDLMSEESKGFKDDGDGDPELLKEYSLLFYRLFDRIFGDGTGEKIFGGKYNVRKCEEYYDDFLNFVHTQKEATNRQRIEILSKYKPARAARRAKK